MSPEITYLLSLASAIIVAILGHEFAKRRKRTDELAEMRLKAYTDFINATSRLVSARRNGKTEDEIDELAALNDAKTRICICADKEVVEALVDFWNAGGTLEEELEILAFTNFCLEVRKSLGNDWKDITMLPISDTLFKLEPSKYSYKANNKHVSRT